MDKILYLTRHAQAYHNVADDYTSPFFPLTRFGSERIAFDSQVHQLSDDILTHAPRRSPGRRADPAREGTIRRLEEGHGNDVPKGRRLDRLVTRK